jgi:sugar lactone lactonase YvrE
MFRKSILFSIIILIGMTQCAQNLKCDLVYDAKAGVGEGALWDEPTQRLYWIDISGKKLYMYSPETKEITSYATPKEIGTVVVIDNDNVLLVLSDGMYEFNIPKKELMPQLIPDIDTNLVRFNDGKCSPDGKLWVGTMHKGVTEPVAALYRLSENYKIKKMVDSVTVSNGIIWSPDGTKMYYIDSPTRTVVSYDYDVKRAEISNKKCVVNTPKEWGNPDGCTIDSKGNIWIAHWGGGIVSCWNPQTGKLVDTIHVPAPNVTSVAFGGKDKDILFITTARNWMKPGDEEKYPHAGGLFCIRPGVSGIKSYSYKP